MRPWCLAALGLILLSGCNLIPRQEPADPHSVGCPPVQSGPNVQHNSWAPAAPMFTRRYFPAATTGCDGRIYVIGGLSSWDGGQVVGTREISTMEVYTPGTRTWATAAPMPTPRADLAVVTGSDGRIYAIGGAAGGDLEALSTVEVYSPDTNTWTAGPPLPIPLGDVDATRGRDGRIYAIDDDVMEIYSPDTKTWTTGPPPPTKRHRLVLATGHDGRIYAIGGYDGSATNSGPVDVVEVYDPGTGTWAPAAPMPIPLGQTAGATGPDGRIYVFGGDKDWTSPRQNIVEVYTPSSNTWAMAAPMPTERSSHAATLGPDGRIYVIGGTDNQTGPGLSELRRVDAFSP